jgi:hypothetical protein
MQVAPAPQLVVLDRRIRRYLAKCPPAVSGERGHDQTFKVAVALVWGFALRPEDALFYLRLYSAACEPPWSEHELAHKIESALQVEQFKPVGYLRCYRK